MSRGEADPRATSARSRRLDWIEVLVVGAGSPVGWFPLPAPCVPCQFARTMGDINEWIGEHHGQVDALGHLAAFNQRNRQIQQQREQVAALREQTAVLERQNRIEQDRARIEQQRLGIECQRLAAEKAEREMRRQQAEQVKELRNLIADVTISLGRFRKRHLA